MSYNKRQAATSGMSATRFNQEAANLNASGQSAPRVSSPNSRLLDELLALGSSSRNANGPRQRASNSSSADNQSNITIIDYRQGAPIASAAPFSLLVADGGASAPGDKSDRRRSTFDQFASQFKSSLGLGERRRSRQGSNNEPIPPLGSQNTLPALVPPFPPATGNVQILDIRRTKTNRRRPKQSGTNRLSRDYENVMPCQLARDDEYEDDDDSDERDDDGDKNRGDQVARDRPAAATAATGQSDHLHEQTDTTIRNKNQPNQPKQQQQQQRQQSGETLSSFESDYDLLVYLGETETEDLVETERSLDYLDQTWRQSICGGASLAPTIDESLSELLQTPENRFGGGGSSSRAPLVEGNGGDDFDQLWTQTNTTGSRARGHRQDAASALNYRSASGHRLTPGQQQQQARGDQSNLLADLSYGNINQTRNWSTSLPRSQVQHNSGGQQPASGRTLATQLEVKSPRGRETKQLSGDRLEQQQVANASGGHLDKQPDNQQAQSLAGNIGNKLAALFKPNQTRQQQQQQQADQSGARQQRPTGGGLTKQEAETVRQLNEFLEQARLNYTPMEAPQKPRRHQGAGGGGPDARAGRANNDDDTDELDRLLAEMSQSLDLDSLARYDPYSRGAQRPQQQQQVGAVPSAGRSAVSKMAATPKRQSPIKTTGASRQHAEGQRQPMGRNEFILNEYDGASRMLEQMINDQLDEARLVSGPGGDSRKSRNERVAQHSAARSGQNNSTSGPTSDEDRASFTSQARKISSTCSTTTETSVVPSAAAAAATARGRPQMRTIPIEVLGHPEPAQPSKLAGDVKTKAQMVHQISLDAGPPAASQHARPAQSDRRRLNYSRSLEAAAGPADKFNAPVERLPPIEPTKTLVTKTTTTEAKPLTPPVNGSKSSSTSSMEAADEDDGRDVPPPPPVVDYNDFNEEPEDEDQANISKQLPDSSQSFKVLRTPMGQENHQLIQVEPNELPSPTSSEDEQSSRPVSDGRHKHVMNRMKRRTISGVRSVRHHFGRHFQGGVSTDASTEPTEPTATSSNLDREGREPNPVPPPRSHSIGSSTRSVSGSRRPETEASSGLVAESPRRSRQRSRQTAVSEQQEQQQPVEGGAKKSFGQQIRERLSRSKSRLSHFLRPLSLHRQQQQQQHAASEEVEREEQQREVPLFQPSDIARNEPPAPFRGGGESSLERQLRADLYEPINLGSNQKRSPPSGRSRHDSDKSLGSGDLSGLETVTNNRPERLFKRKSRQTKRGAELEEAKGQRTKRPTSLMSLKRFGESFGRIGNKTVGQEIGRGADEVEDLEQQMTSGAAAAAHRKRASRNKRLRNRSTGDQRNSPGDQEPAAIKSVTPSRATTDDYFGFKAPIKTSPVAGGGQSEAPPANRGLEVHQRVEMGPRVVSASAMAISGSGGDGETKRPTSAEHVVGQQHRVFGGGRRRQRVAPNRSQSLKGSDFTGARPSGGETTRLESAAETGQRLESPGQVDGGRQKSVSFQNLAQANHQRRPLSPVSPNTFRPVSASPGQELLVDENKSSNALVSPVHRTGPGAITPIQLVPILSNHTEAAQSTTGPSSGQSAQGATALKHDRGSALLQDLRNKCSDLFGPNQHKRAGRTPRESPTPVATTSGGGGAELTPPSRPPRTRKRRDPNQTSAAFRSRSLAAPTLSVIELEPASPPPASPFQAASESPNSHLADRPTRAVKRLTSFAQQLKTSAADFFAAGPPTSQTRPANQNAACAPAQTSQTTVECRPQFRNLDEPLLQRDLAHWRPIIPLGGGGGGNSNGQRRQDKVVRRSSSFRLAKDDENKSRPNADERSRTLAGGDQANQTAKVVRGARERDGSCSDSTWDSSSSDGDEQDEANDKRPTTRNIQRKVRGRTKATHPHDSSPASENADGEAQQVAAARAVATSRRCAANSRAATGDNEQMRAAAAGAAASSSANIWTENKNNNQDQNNNNRNSFQASRERNLRHLEQASQRRGNDKAVDRTKPATGTESSGGGAPFGLKSTQSFNGNGSCEPVPGDNSNSENSPESRDLERDTNANVEHIAQSCSVNERAFKFHEDLPSPSQILNEIKRESDASDQDKARREGDSEASKMTATRSARRGRVVVASNADDDADDQRDGGAKSQVAEHARERDDQVDANRLSIYENVNSQDRLKPQQTPPRESALKLPIAFSVGNLAKNNGASQLDESVGQSKTTPRDADEEKKPERATRAQRAASGKLVADDENSQQDDWSVEPIGQLQPVTRISSNLKQQEQLTKTAAGAATGDSVQRSQLKAAFEPVDQMTTTTSQIRTDSVRPTNARRAERKLVPMTSIIHEPEDELMNLKTSSSIAPSELSPRGQNSPSATTGDDQRRRQSNFSFQNGNSDNDDSESSLSLGCGRRRLENKLTRQREQQERSRPQKPPVPSRPPNLPRATGPAASGGGGGGSLVRRLARNFDQAVQQQQPEHVRGAPSLTSRTNVAAQSQPMKQSAGHRPSPPRAQQQQDFADEPKSDSTWYDAKSIELLDEAEVAELLREFESEGQDQTNQQLLSDSDQYVTLSQDQPGRRDAKERGLASGGGEDDDDDATLNDDETLNDANDDDDGDLLDASNGHEEESVYVSAAATNENVSRASRGGGGDGNDCQSRLDVGSLSCDESLLVGGADRSRHSGRVHAAAGVVVVVDDDDDGEKCLCERDAAACGGGERKACASSGRAGGQLLEHCVAPSEQTATSQLDDATALQPTTNDNADPNNLLTTPCANQSGQPSQPTPSTKATCVTRANDHDDEAEPMKELQIEHGQEEGDPKDRQLFTGRLFKCFNVNKTLGERVTTNSDKLQDGPTTTTITTTTTMSQDNESDDDDEDESSSAANNMNELNSEQSSSCREDLISLSSSSLSSESMPELRQRKNLQKLYNIVNEICTSEEKFLATLRLLNEDFRRHILTSLVAQTNSTNDTKQSLADLTLLQQPPFDCIGLVMKHLPQLQALNENLYDELRQARNRWPSTHKISHVLVKIGPFLKHYSSYIRDFECIQQQFQENMKKWSQFRETIKRFERDEAEKCCHLSIQHHLLRPIQRIPQYRLLLQQYLHHLKPDDADYEDTVSALEVVSRVAEHANQSLSEGANFAKLLSLQAKIVGGKQRDIIQPGRLFIKEGELLKVCRKQIQPRWFVLLSDALFYLKQIQSNDILYLKYELPLDDCQVELPSGCNQTPSGSIEEVPRDETQSAEKSTTEQSDCELNICTTVRSMTLIAKSRQERDDWFQALKSAIESQVAKRRSFKPGQQLDPTAQEPFNGLIGRKAPIWTPDSRVNTCQLCTSNFSALFRRHHCRACGRVVCSACSSNKAPLIYLKCRAARVCDTCFESLRANMHLYYLPSCQIDERELRRLDGHFKTLLKSQFVKKRMFASSKAPKVVLLKGPNTTTTSKTVEADSKPSGSSLE